MKTTAHVAVLRQ